jgi:hypothetical protein
VPLTIMWAFQYGFGPDWLGFWQVAVDVWLVGHGVDLVIVPDAGLVAALGIPGAEAPVPVTIAALGFALATVLLGVRAGARIAESGHRLLGEVTAILVVAVLSALATLSTLDGPARPDLLQGVALPTLVFAVGVVIGILREGVELGPDPLGTAVRDWIAERSPRLRVAVLSALRAGAAATAGTVLIASVAVAALVFASFGELIRLYEGLHGGVVGGVALTLGQLALLPNLVVWAVSWFVGPGFAVGVGSSVSPLGTALGPLPAVPLLGAIPTGDLEYGFAGLAAPVVAAFVGGAAVRRALARGLGDGGRFGRMPWYAGVVVGGALTGGVLVAVLAWASSGAAGPGRLVVVGPDPVLVGAVAALEFAIGGALGLAASGVVLADRGAARADEGGREHDPAADAHAEPVVAHETSSPRGEDAASAPAAPMAPSAPAGPAAPSAPSPQDDVDTAPVPIQPRT